MRRRDWAALVPFVRDWLVIATVPIWLPYVVFAFVSQNGPSHVPPIIPSAGLLAYTLAITVAFLDDIPLNYWATSTHSYLRWLARIVPNCKLTIILFTMTILILLIVADLGGSGSVPPATPEQTIVAASALAVVAFLLSFIVILHGRQEKVMIN